MIYPCLANSDSGRYSNCVQNDLLLLQSKVLSLVCYYFQQTSCFSWQRQDNFFTRYGYSLTFQRISFPTPLDWKERSKKFATIHSNPLTTHHAHKFTFTSRVKRMAQLTHFFLTHTHNSACIMHFHEGIIPL